MEPIAVTAALLRNQIPDIALREGSSLMARVASRGEGGRAVLVIAGVPVTAKLPPEIPVGATLKLQVQQVSADRMTLRIVPQSQPGQADPPQQPAAPQGPATYAPPGRAVPGQPTVPGQAAQPGQPAQAAPSGQPAQAPQPGQAPEAAQPGLASEADQAPQPGRPAPAERPERAHLPGQLGQASQPERAAEPGRPVPAPEAAKTAHGTQTAQVPEQRGEAPPATSIVQNPVVNTMAAAMQLQPPKVEVGEPPGRRRGADGEPADVVSLVFNSPTLGRLDLRLELRGERLLAEVTTPSGRPHAVAADAAELLRARLEAAGLDATVAIRPRRESLDLYA